MRRLLILLLFCPLLLTQAQKTKKYPKIDSIKQRKKAKKEISLKGLQLLCNYYDLMRYNDSSYNAINEYLKASKKHNNHKHFTKGLSLKGLHYGQLGIHDSALHYFKKIANFPKVEFNIKQEALNNISVTFRMQNKLDSAIVYIKKAIEYGKKEKYLKGVLTSYNALSNIYADREDYYNRKIYLDSCLFLMKNLKEKIHYSQKVRLLHSLGNFNLGMKDLKNAKKYFFQARDTAEYYKDNFFLFYINKSLATCYIESEKNDSARYFLNKNLNHPNFKKHRHVVLNTYISLYEIELRNKNYLKALEYNEMAFKKLKTKSRDFYILNFQRAEVLSKLGKYNEALKFLNLLDNDGLNKNLSLKKEVHKLYHTLFLNQKKTLKAKQHFEIFTTVSDTLFSKEKIKINGTLQTQYETQQKENKILKQQNELQQKEIALQKERQKTYLYSFLAIIFLLIGGGYTLKLKRDNTLKLLNNSIKISEEEKTRIGRDLHDGIAANLLRLAQEIELQMPNISHKLLTTYNEIRGLSHQLNNTPMHGEVFIDRIFELIPKNTDKKQYQLQINPRYLELEEPIGTHIYRIVQELIANDLKHSNATQVSIAIQEDKNSISFNYQDNGTFTKPINKGKGLKNIEDRTTLLKGKLSINTTNGFYLNLIIPLKKNV